MSNEMKDSNDSFEGLSSLISLYEIIMNAQIQYSQRVWTLFNWFLTIHIGIAGFYLIQGVDSSSFAFIPIIALIIAILWIFIGYQDYKSMNKHNYRRKTIENEVIIKIENCKVSTLSDSFNEDEKSLIRQTWALFVFPVIVLLFWSVLLFIKLFFEI